MTGPGVSDARAALADRLEAYTRISESGRNDDGIEGVAIPRVDCYDFDDLMREAAAELRKGEAPDSFCGIAIVVDQTVPNGTIELRRADGSVAARIQQAAAPAAAGGEGVGS